MSEFEKELGALLNTHSQESASNTPDFILAQYLKSCLSAFGIAVQQREIWYGRDAQKLESRITKLENPLQLILRMENRVNELEDIFNYIHAICLEDIGGQINECWIREQIRLVIPNPREKTDADTV